MASVKNILMTAAAFTFVASVAYAGDNNEIYLDQTGDHGTLSSTQSGNNNTVGTFKPYGRGVQAG